MPQYRCLIQKDRFAREMKAELAREITRVHCELTGAPGHFVHVLFSEFASGDWFTACEPSGFSIVNALIRAGRSDEQKRQLMLAISSGWSRITGQSEREIVVTITDVNSEHWMEAGQLMPQPGGEKEWFERLGISV
ncbi:MAG TPA: tautomerase family protein [Candidatus Angelobacter sp.]|jgi:4-oxalocrotonate tautomerase family enzyme|nr:tautomerase family protein [Candidatus Angelobacter sp.]